MPPTPRPKNWPIEHHSFHDGITMCHTLASDGPGGYAGRCRVCGRWVLRGLGRWWEKPVMGFGC